MLGLSSGCGGGVAGGRPTTDASDDVARDAGADETRPPGVMCPAVAAGEKRGLGACCSAAADCAGGVCWNGFCTKTCATTADCGVVVAPSPLPTGTAMACAPNMLGDAFSYCLPGSLRDCTTAGSAPCLKGEDCALGLKADATMSAVAAAYTGMCLTRLMADSYLPAGSTCQPETGPYACENQGGYLGSGCVAHRCTRACASSNDCPIGMQCQPAPYSTKLGGAVSYSANTTSSPGICLGRFCGQVHGELGTVVGQVVQQGADALCPKGDICAPTIAVGATGDTQYLSCIPPRPDALAFGAACSKDPSQKLRCADDALCAERSGKTFCSTLCRVDADCPTGAFCVDDYPSAPLPNGAVARLGMCTPRAMIAATLCRTEKDCAATESCRPLSARSNQPVCTPTTGTKSVGQACGSAAECRGGECTDRDLRTPTGKNATYCSGPCLKNSDCGTGQICLRVVRNSNGTPDDPRDDIIVGACATLDAPALTGGCATNDNCTGQISIDETGGDTCDPTHHTCFTLGAHIGDPCAHRADCPLGAYCRLNDPLFPGGACLSLGCDSAATTGVDACPTGSVCTQRATDTPLKSCYPACVAGSACARASEGYMCRAATSDPGAAQICIWQGGT